MLTNIYLNAALLVELTDFVTCPTYTACFDEWVVIVNKTKTIEVKRFINERDYARYISDLILLDGNELIDHTAKSIFKAKKKYVYICYL